jgi:hypothetical protein
LARSIEFFSAAAPDEPVVTGERSRMDTCMAQR